MDFAHLNGDPNRPLGVVDSFSQYAGGLGGSLAETGGFAGRQLG
jgi:hypothetical protein